MKYNRTAQSVIYLTAVAGFLITLLSIWHLVRIGERGLEDYREACAAAEKIGVVDLRLDENLSVLELEKKLLIHQADSEQGRNEPGRRYREKGTRRSYWGGLVNINRQGPNVSVLSVQAPFKGSIRGIRIGSACALIRTLANREGECKHLDRHDYGGFDWGPRRGPAPGRHQWYLQWEEDSDHKIVRLTMYNREYDGLPVFFPIRD